MSGHGTGYTETEALLDALDADGVSVRRELARMTRMERERLREALDRLRDVLDELD